ncbi:AHH domain-containing protein [Pedobacter sandarakinus]|uniref:AHH domain-containing protein n=1 Tax=Pedobacter sandarakinus TaxID=353156 RepID=UPI0022472457|nr:AHH domain-containing protein [Pedobacter sandarakinus]MCX2573590.1 AHH domain-containing protein [Pedobacter sandarakinus]
MIRSGSEYQLRQTLKLAKGNPLQAHHIIPWEFTTNTMVQKAAEYGFRMNVALNEIALSKSVHVEGMVHNVYNTTVVNKLNKIVTDYGANLTTYIAETELKNLISQIRNWIVTHSGQNINNLILS